MDFFCNDTKDFKEDGELTENEWREWRSQFLIGEPVPVKGSGLTVNALKKKGRVGLYRR